MCGILGIASSQTIENLSIYLEGVKTMSHRGPDSSGKWHDSNSRVGFAHQRLSIIDLSEKGHQPMSDIDCLNTIIFNGEIYNFSDLYKKLSKKGYKFKSKTDTEVILAAYSEWGIDCVNYLNGMFAFSIYDSKNNILFIARDRSGEKPLFYNYKKGVLFFASELKALMAGDNLPKKINSKGLDFYLSFGFIPGENCILEGFKKLPAAHTLVYKLNEDKISINKYWHLPSYRLSANRPLIEELEELLEASVKNQLQADVPVGILLSGGVDSSLITAMAARHTDKIKTFNVRFPNAGKFDETEYARLISQNFNTEHIELEASSVDADLLIKLAKQFDEPIVDSSMIPTYLISQLVRKHCKVVLGGDGGDELFGGYEHYSRLILMQKIIKFIPSLLLRKKIALFSENFFPNGMKGKNWISSLKYDFNTDIPLIANYFDPKSRKNLMKNYSSNWEITAEEILYDFSLESDNLLQSLTRFDFSHYLTEDILVKVDRASMLNSLEIRAPFLDRNLIEFAFRRVPSSYKANSKNKKILLKRLSKKILPANFDLNRKQGFSIPINDWLKEGSFRDFFYNILLDSQTIFDKQSILELLKAQDKGLNNGERLFALVMFELWRREHKVSF